jgi:hypothetical protein
MPTPTTIEYVFTQFLQALLNAILSGINVFEVILPKDYISLSNPKAIVYHSILNEPLYTLNGQNKLMTWEVQIDCHGFTMQDAITLANTVDKVLSGGLGDSVTIEAIFKLPSQVDGYSDSNRTFIRSLEYQIHYIQF